MGGPSSESRDGGFSMIDLVVAVTFGQRDLQVLGVSSGGIVSVSPEGKQVRAFHQWLLDHEDAYDVVGPDEFTTPIKEQGRFAMAASGVQLPDASRVTFAKNSDLGRSKPDDGRILVFPKLLAGPLLSLRRELATGRAKLHRLTILYTHRSETSNWAAGEPIAADILRAWLQRWLPMVEADVLVSLVAFLRGMEELYVKDPAENEHLLPQAAQRIDQAIADAASCVPQPSQAIIRLHDSGGIPQASPVLQASARLHFSNRVQYHAPTESASPSLDRDERVVIFPAVAVLEARRRACELVRRGDFQAAAQLALEFPKFGPPWTWNQCLAAVARYFQGYLEDADKQAEAIGSGPTRRALKNILNPAQPMSLHVALRAEAALAASDFLNAASLTVTFLDVAEYDAINLCLSRDRSRPCMDRASRQIDSSRFSPTKEELRQAVNAACTTAPWLRPPRQRDLDAWLSADTFRTMYPWQECAIFQLLESHAARTDLGRALRELLTALHRETNTGNIPADFRNIKDHSVMTDGEIQLMTQLFESDSRLLWWRRKGEPRSFLSGAGRAAGVLAALGVTNAQQLYDNLVQGLLSDLHSCPLA